MSPFAPNTENDEKPHAEDERDAAWVANGIFSVMNDNESNGKREEEREEDPNAQLELESRRRSSGVNGREGLPDVEMS